VGDQPSHKFTEGEAEEQFANGGATRYPSLMAIASATAGNKPSATGD
jgi:hypothetical protein